MFTNPTNVRQRRFELKQTQEIKLTAGWSHMQAFSDKELAILDSEGNLILKDITGHERLKRKLPSAAKGIAVLQDKRIVCFSDHQNMIFDTKTNEIKDIAKDLCVTCRDGYSHSDCPEMVGITNANLPTPLNEDEVVCRDTIRKIMKIYKLDNLNAPLTSFKFSDIESLGNVLQISHELLAVELFFKIDLYRRTDDGFLRIQEKLFGYIGSRGTFLVNKGDKRWLCACLHPFGDNYYLHSAAIDDKGEVINKKVGNTLHVPWGLNFQTVPDSTKIFSLGCSEKIIGSDRNKDGQLKDVLFIGDVSTTEITQTSLPKPAVRLIALRADTIVIQFEGEQNLCVFKLEEKLTLRQQHLLFATPLPGTITDIIDAYVGEEEKSKNII